MQYIYKFLRTHKEFTKYVHRPFGYLVFGKNFTVLVEELWEEDDLYFNRYASIFCVFFLGYMIFFLGSVDLFYPQESGDRLKGCVCFFLYILLYFPWIGLCYSEIVPYWRSVMSTTICKGRLKKISNKKTNGFFNKSILLKKTNTKHVCVFYEYCLGNKKYKKKSDINIPLSNNIKDSKWINNLQVNYDPISPSHSVIFHPEIIERVSFKKSQVSWARNEMKKMGYHDK